MGSSRIGARVTLLAGIAALGTTLVVLRVSAQDSVSAPILHEDLTPPAEQVARTAARAKERQAVLGPEPSEGQNPNAISAGPKLLPEPSAAQPRASGETVFGQPKSFGADRETESRPDYNTGADGTLHYVEVFNPSVVPFKRMTSLDAVAPNYSLTTDQSVRRDLEVGGLRAANRELFWGSLLIELQTDQDVAIPSVSPEMRILSYEVEPKVNVSFSKDGADNYYVRTEEAGIKGAHRLVFLADASSLHFAPNVPKTVRVSDIPAAMVRPMPRNVRDMAARGLKHLRLHDGNRLSVALDVLVNYFRNFEAKEPPPPSGDIYWDLFINQAGVCRHRAFVFMVTANALGIPSRYLANEAHAWVEVFIPGQGWVRIDLGGAALRLEVTNANDKAMHRPRGDDPFPKPPNYENNYTQLVGDIDGLSADQIAERQAPSDDPMNGASGSRGSGAAGDGDGDDFFDQSDEASGPDGRDAQGRLIGPGRGLPAIPDDELENKAPTTISVGEASSQGYRGESIVVTGSLRSGASGVGGQTINIFMTRIGDDDDDSIRVGYTKSRRDGTFEATVRIPISFDLASYEIHAATPGDDTYAPAVSE